MSGEAPEGHNIQAKGFGAPPCMTEALSWRGMRWIFCMWAAAAWAQTFELPATVKQGGVIRVRGPAAAVAARMDERKIRLFPQTEGSVLGLMPIPADQKPGSYRVELLDAKNAVLSNADVMVLDAHFRKQNVTIESEVAELKPSAGESETAMSFRQAVSDTRYWSEPLMLPEPGCMTSLYGVQRYLNGKPTGNIHAGLDQRAPKGTPVRAVADGVVKIVREWNLHGNTVGIDHGQGLESMYQHLSRFAVAEGATVKKGDVIGYSGSTGRSNAPHLHWTLYVNSVPVNPLEWVKVASCYAGPSKARPKR
jgi:murein DD-endopeptidase MepM/ murein hydrolase activator NlpD